MITRDIEAAFDRHRNGRIALHFSGGKDSLCCLYLLKDFWDKLTVVWVNAGACYPETLEQMSVIRKLVPHFLEVKSDQPSVIEKYGFPSDIVPIANAEVGQHLRRVDVKIQPWTSCCWMSLWEPMQLKMVELGVTLVIRGQKKSDYRTAPIKSGHVEKGIEYLFPLEDWTHDDCLEFLKENNVQIPSWYEWSETSLDCWDCTACLDERIKEISNLKWKHPEKWDVVKTRLSIIRKETMRETDLLDNIIGVNHA